MGTRTDMTGRTLFWGLLGLAFLAYVPVLKHFPVADSWIFLEPKSLAETAGYFVKSVIPAEWNALWFRPLPMFTYWLDTKLWPDSFWGPHLINILLHLANTALIWHLVRKMLVNGSGGRTPVMPSFAAGLVYAIHPLTVGSVAWIAARFDVMSVTLGLCALWFWLSWKHMQERTGYLIGCLVLLAGALLSKEQGIVFTGVVFLSACYGAYTDATYRRRFVLAAAAAVLLIVVYFGYRMSLFGGLGGYLESRQTLSIKTPLGFFTALFFPYPNPAPQWRLNLLPVLTTGVLGLLGMLLFRTPQTPSGRPGPFALVVSAALLGIGIASTAPHAGLTFMSILGHIESRFALIGLAGLALCIGCMWALWIKSARTQQTALIILLVWAVTALWRTDIQVAAWRSASETAHHIIETTVREVPDPPRGSSLYYLNIPSYSAQYAYIYGIGLKEALHRVYPGRDDLTIYPRARQGDLGNANPARDAVFGFNRETWALDHLRPQRR